MGIPKTIRWCVAHERSAQPRWRLAQKERCPLGGAFGAGDCDMVTLEVTGGYRWKGSAVLCSTGCGQAATVMFQVESHTHPMCSDCYPMTNGQVVGLIRSDGGEE